MIKMSSTSQATESRAIERGEKVMACMPFRKRFYLEIKEKGLSAQELIARDDWQMLVFAPFGRERAEAHFRWLIKNGLLRREVDGQGLTSRVRLTHLGEKIIEESQDELRRAGIRERMNENFRRYAWIRGQ